MDDIRVQVRIVYFQSALTHSNTDYQAKLGVETYFEAPLLEPAFIQLSGASRRRQFCWRFWSVVTFSIISRFRSG